MLVAKLFMRETGHVDFVILGHVPVDMTYQEAQGTKKLGLLIFDGHHKEPSFFELLPDNTYKRPRDARSQYNRDLTVCIYMHSTNISKHEAEDSRGRDVVIIVYKSKDIMKEFFCPPDAHISLASLWFGEQTPIVEPDTGNIVEWWQSTSRADYLLIFQNEISCSYIWGIIGRMQRDFHLNYHGDATSPEGPLYPGSSDLRKLPSVDLSSLPLLLKKILESKFSDQMRIAELLAQDNDFLPKLMDLFKICEDSKNIHGLHLIYGLVRSIILLSNIPVFDRLFSGKCLMGVVGALEYNPEEPKAQNHCCRLEKVVNEHVIYKEALPVKDQSVFTKLCRSYGVDYIKDVILLGTLDEVTIASLSLFVYANNVMLYSSLKDDSCFIRELLAKLKSDSISPDSQRDLALLLCELWSFSQSTKSTQISDFWWGIIDGKTYNITVTVMQTIIAQNDEHWIHRVVKNNLLRLVIEIFCEVGNRTNVFHDGVLQLLEYIAKGDMKVLVIYLWEMFSEKLKKFNMLPSIQALKIKYKCLEDREQKTECNIAKGQASNKAEERDLDKLAAEGDFKEEDLWTHVLSFYKKIIHEKEKVD